MSVTFIKECNYLGEAVSLLSIYYQKENFTNLQQRLKKKSGYSTEVDRILRLMQHIYEEIIVQLDLPQELSIYFDYFNEEVRAEGLAFCMLHEGICAKDIAFHKLAAYMKENFHQNPSSFISAVFDSDDLQGELSDEAFVKELEKMQTPDNIKWNIWRIYKNYDEHVDALMKVIEDIIPIMRKVYANYETEFISFYEYWEKASADDTFYEKLKLATRIDIQDDTALTIQPSWMGCNSVRLIATSKDLYHTCLLLGLLFSEKEFVDDANLTREEICMRLKLLSDSSKYEIMKLIKDQSLYGSQLAEKLSLSTATISHHVNGLASAGLINIAKDSNRVYYQLNKAQVGFLLDEIRKDLYDD